MQRINWFIYPHICIYSYNLRVREMKGFFKVKLIPLCIYVILNFILTCCSAIVTLSRSSWNIKICWYEKITVHHRWWTYGRHIRRRPSQVPQMIHHPEIKEFSENWQFRSNVLPDRSSLWRVLQTSHDWTPSTVISV